MAETSKNAQITNFTHEECIDEEDCIPGTPGKLINYVLTFWYYILVFIQFLQSK